MNIARFLGAGESVCSFVVVDVPEEDSISKDLGIEVFCCSSQNDIIIGTRILSTNCSLIAVLQNVCKVMPFRTIWSIQSTDT